MNYTAMLAYLQAHIYTFSAGVVAGTFFGQLLLEKGVDAAFKVPPVRYVAVLFYTTPSAQAIVKTIEDHAKAKAEQAAKEDSLPPQ